MRRNRSNSVFGLGASGGDSGSRLGASDGSGAIVRGAACRFLCARIAAFISSRCDWSAIAGTSTAPGCRLLPYPPAVCFEVDSEPPIPAISGAAVSHDDLVLVAADGNPFAAFLASPDEPTATGIVILPDVRGLYRFYEELALRFAERGHAAIAIDYFGRTAGVAKRDADFEYAEHVQATKPDTVQADVAAAAGRLRELGCTSIFTVGFYGMPGERNGAPGPTERAAELEAPILALQAGDDGNITAEHNAAFEAALAAAGVEHEVVTYPGAPHSFFDRKQEDYADASEDAWRRVLDFLEHHG